MAVFNTAADGSDKVTVTISFSVANVDKLIAYAANKYGVDYYSHFDPAAMVGGDTPENRRLDAYSNALVDLLTTDIEDDGENDTGVTSVALVFD